MPGQEQEKGKEEPISSIGGKDETFWKKLLSTEMVAKSAPDPFPVISRMPKKEPIILKRRAYLNGKDVTSSVRQC